MQASGRIKECIQCCLCHRSPTIASCFNCGRRCCRHCLEGDFRADGGSGFFGCRACVGCDWTDSGSDSALPKCHVAGAGGSARGRCRGSGRDAPQSHSLDRSFRMQEVRLGARARAVSDASERALYRSGRLARAGAVARDLSRRSASVGAGRRPVDNRLPLFPFGPRGGRREFSDSLPRGEGSAVRERPHG